MPISAREIEEKEFAIVRLGRGYKIEEVDDFLDELSAEIESLRKENAGLQAQVAACQEKEKRIAEMEQTLRDTLITAQRAAEDVIRASREKAAAMIKDSELEGRRIVEDSELRAEAAVQRREAIERDIAGVKALIRRVLGEQLRLLEESYPEPAAAAAPAAAEAQGDKPAPFAGAALTDFDRTQEFSAREVREQATEEEHVEFPRIKSLLERLPPLEPDGEDQA
jgi:cell division initiation protein